MGRDEVRILCRLPRCCAADRRRRKVEGEAKDTGHGEGKGVSAAASVPLRRWEDWERSRLRKIRREEKRRRDFARAHPQGFVAGDEYLSARSGIESTYDGSDAASLASSDDQWGPSIGEYNENNAKYPPPPAGLLPQGGGGGGGGGGGLITEGDLEAMLDAGWDDGPGVSPSGSTDALHAAPSHSVPPTPGTAPRYQLSDGAGYAPVRRGGPASPTTPGATSSALDWKTHAKKRSSSERRDYGPLGPLDPATTF
jgi:chitin synthase